MYCSKCGKELKENENFCSNCGNSIVTPNINTSTQEKTETKNNNEGCATQIFSIIGGLIFIGFIFNLGIFDIFGTSSTNEGTSNNLVVTESHSCSLGYGAKAICGTVKNNSSRNYGYVHVEINLYDKNGNLIDSTLDNVNNLEGNATWKFQAPIINDNVATYKIKNITGY